MGSLLLVTTLIALGQAARSSQDPHAQMNHRGAMVMGFDQTWDDRLARIPAGSQARLLETLTARPALAATRVRVNLKR